MALQLNNRFVIAVTFSSGLESLHSYSVALLYLAASLDNKKPAKAYRLASLIWCVPVS